MRIDGAWRLCDDGIVRPVIRGEVRCRDGSFVQTLFLADTAADRTVLSPDILQALGLEQFPISEPLAGVGGQAPCIIVETSIQMQRETGQLVIMKGRFAAVTDPRALDMSVLGRDITNLFAVIVDRPGDIVCMIRQGHRYAIQQE